MLDVVWLLACLCCAGDGLQPVALPARFCGLAQLEHGCHEPGERIGQCGNWTELELLPMA